MNKIVTLTDQNRPWLVVGQGLAGTVLALEFARRNQPFVVADADLPWASSRVAVGAFNPVTGKRMQLTWQADILWPILETFYPAAEQGLQTRFFYSLPNLRPLFTQQERVEAEKLATSGPLASWIKLVDALPWLPASDVVAPFGAILVPRAGFVDVAAFCQAARRWLQSIHAFISHTIEPSAIQPDSEGIIFQGQLYRGVIWAQGHLAKSNPLQANLPLAPLKGEILHLQPTNPPKQAGAVLNRNAYLAPRPDGSFWAGSTYQHQFDTPTPTPEGRASILERVQKFYTGNVEVISHLSGIRPSVLDRRPLVGPLSEPGHFIFNGLGTKGVSLAPWLAQQLCEYLLEGKALPPEILSNRKTL